MPFDAEIAHALLGVPAEELGGVGHLAARVRQRLAVLDGDELGEPLGVAHDQLVGLAQNFAALARLLRGPGPERALRGVERGLGVVDAGAGDRGDLVLGRRIDHVEARAVGGLFPFAADPQIGRDVGEKVVVCSHDCTLHSVIPGATAGRTRNPETQLCPCCWIPGHGASRRPGMTASLTIQRLLHPIDDAVDASAGWRLRECRRPAAGCAAW